MNDTTPEMRKLQHDLLMQRSGPERLRMACSMFDTAKALAAASLEGVNEKERPAQLFLRFYGRDFDEKTKARIVAALTR